MGFVVVPREWPQMQVCCEPEVCQETVVTAFSVRSTGSALVRDQWHWQVDDH